MTLTHEATTTCEDCGVSCSVVVYPSVNVTVHPGFKAQVLDGSLFGHECPACGEQTLLCYDSLYHDMSQRLQVWWRPEGNAPDPVLPQMSDGSVADGYRFRWVARGIELAEKVRVFDAGLDDRVVELVKASTQGALTFVGERGRGSERFLEFERLDADEGLSVPFATYEDLARRYQSKLGSDQGWQRIDRQFALRVTGRFRA